jgi:hypothetical protein
LILAFVPGERQLISYRSNPPPLPVGWYLGQYIDRCIILKTWERLGTRLRYHISDTVLMVIAVKDRQCNIIASTFDVPIETDCGSR